MIANVAVIFDPTKDFCIYFADNQLFSIVFSTVVSAWVVQGRMKNLSQNFVRRDSQVNLIFAGYLDTT